MQIRKHRGFWRNINNCRQEALRYKSRSEFMKKGRGAVSAAVKMGIYEEICSHMEPMANGYIRYGYAIEFPEFKKVYVGITSNLSRRKWQHLHVKYGVCNSSNKHVRNLIESGEIYKWVELDGISDKATGKSYENSMIDKYVNNGWYKLNVAAAGGLGTNRKYWNKKRCHTEALKYKSITDFVKGSSSAYNSARENKWLSDICSHIVKSKKPNGFWNDKDKCISEASKYETRALFMKNNPSAYKWVWKNNWVNEAMGHMKEIVKPVGYWDKKMCLSEALKYTERTLFMKGSPCAYASAQRNGWLKDMYIHMPEKVKPNGYWSYDVCLNEALKYTNKTDFIKGCQGAYNAANRDGWMTTICSHFVRKNKSKKNGRVGLQKTL